MTPKDILDDIISRLDPEEIPADYIVMAKLTDFDGNERIIRGEELREFMQSPFEHAAEARIILDVRKIRKAIVEEVNWVYDEVNKLFSAKFGGSPD